MELAGKFKKLHIDVNNSRQDSDFVRCILVQINEMLRGKSVHVKFIHPDNLKDVRKTEESLLSFMLIRCQDFKVLNTELSESQVSKIVAVITSDRPILNLYMAYDSFREYCEATCCICGDATGFSPVHCNEIEWHLFDDAVARFDAAEFYALRAISLRMIDKDREIFERPRRRLYKNDVELDEDGLPVRNTKND